MRTLFHDMLTGCVESGGKDLFSVRTGSKSAIRRVVERSEMKTPLSADAARTTLSGVVKESTTLPLPDGSGTGRVTRSAAATCGRRRASKVIPDPVFRRRWRGHCAVPEGASEALGLGGEERERTDSVLEFDGHSARGDASEWASP